MGAVTKLSLFREWFWIQKCFEGFYSFVTDGLVLCNRWFGIVLQVFVWFLYRVLFLRLQRLQNWRCLGISGYFWFEGFLSDIFVTDRQVTRD